MQIPLTKQTVVDCNTWDRAAKSKVHHLSRLLTLGGKRCCLGFAAKQSGVDDEHLLNRGTPGEVERGYNAQIRITGLVEKAGEFFYTSIWAKNAMHINDDHETNTHEKITLLRKHWKKLGEGFSVRFTNIPQGKNQEK